MNSNIECSPFRRKIDKRKRSKIVKPCFGKMGTDETDIRFCPFCLDKTECFQETHKTKHHLAIDTKTRRIIIY